MANPAPKIGTISDQYNTIYDDTALRYGIQNPQVTRRESQSPTSRPSEDSAQAKPKIRYQGPSEVINFAEGKTKREQILAARYYADNDNQANPVTSTSKTTPAGKVVVSLADKNTATAWMIITNSWSLTFWSIIQFWAGLISSLFFGLTAAVTYSYIGDAISTIATWFGYTQPNLISLGFWGLITAGAIGLLSLLAAYFHAKQWGIESVFGQGSIYKITALLIAITGYCLPLLNMIPWICLWTLTVRIYPK